MKVAVVGANGKAGKLICNEALKRGLDVTAIVRNENKSGAEKCIVKDLYDLTDEDLKHFDVVVDAFGNFNPESAIEHQTSLKYLSDLLSHSNTRLIVVGGAGSLYLDDSFTRKLMDTPDFPNAFKPLASNMSKALDELRKRDDVKWTYISPAADFQYDGAKTGTYELAGEIFSVNKNNESIISYADYALAVVDEIESAAHVQKRISVFQK